MSGTWQLGALMKKNFILMKRSYCATLCEIFFPIILMILLVIIRRLIKIEKYDTPIVDQEYLKTNSTLLIDPSEFETNPQWESFNFRDPL